jgi:hypothetical protein
MRILMLRLLATMKQERRDASHANVQREVISFRALVLLSGPCW